MMARQIVAADRGGRSGVHGPLGGFHDQRSAPEGNRKIIGTERVSFSISVSDSRKTAGMLPEPVSNQRFHEFSN